MYYNAIKKYYKMDVSLVYIDTDSFLLNFRGIDIHNEVAKGPPAKYMYLSNFNINHPSYDAKNKGKLGLLKSETASIPMKETCAVMFHHSSCFFFHGFCKVI